MSSLFSVEKKAMVNLLQSRNMTLENIEGLYEKDGEFICTNLLQLSEIASALNVSLAHVLKNLEKIPEDISDKVKICRRGSQFERLKLIDSEPAYIYRHVMKTSADQHLMVLRTSPMFSSPDKSRLNNGHFVKELVYVLSGAVGVLWKSKTGFQRQDVLTAGDSIYIDSWVPHSFYSLEADSQILAVDYA